MYHKPTCNLIDFKLNYMDIYLQQLAAHIYLFDVRKFKDASTRIYDRPITFIYFYTINLIKNSRP